MKLRKIRNYWKYSKKQCKYQTTFVFISCKTTKIGVNSTKCRVMINRCSINFVYFSLVNFVLACFVFKYSLNFSRWCGDRNRNTFSGVYSNFNSFIADENKHGLIFTLLFRIFLIVSDFSKFHEEVNYLKNVLK